MSSKKATILVVDDAPSNIDILLSILEDDYEVLVATDGEGALELAHEEMPDLILLDIIMPKMDGFEVIRRLKRDGKTVMIPVVFLTSKSEAEDIIAGFELGAVDYINKPFNSRELMVRVSTHIKLKQYQDQIDKERQSLKVRNYQLEKDIDMARAIQMKLIPKKAPLKGLASFYRPMESVGGDFYDFFTFEKEPDKVGIFLSDVSGHGVPAAFITSMIKSFLAEAQSKMEQPATFMENLNNSLYDLTAGNFATAFYGIYDVKTREFVYSNAGHNLPYIIQKEEVKYLPCPKKGLPLAVYDQSFLSDLNKNYTQHNYTLEPGSKLLIYTDGLTEAVPFSNADIEPEHDFEQIMPEVLLSLFEEPAERLIRSLYEELCAFRQKASFEDDICMVLLES